MSVMRRPAEIMIVGDTPAFGKMVAAILRSGEIETVRLRHTTYESFRGMLSPRLIRGTDLFILDLWRTYSTGLRAEGLAVAEELIRHRALPLVVSPLSFGSETSLSWYWDVASADALGDRCRRLLKSGAIPPMRGAERLNSCLEAYLVKPAGHADVQRK